MAYKNFNDRTLVILQNRCNLNYSFLIMFKYIKNNNVDKTFEYRDTAANISLSFVHNGGYQ
jgi:hypothetical protein